MNIQTCPKMQKLAARLIGDIATLLLDHPTKRQKAQLCTRICRTLANSMQNFAKITRRQAKLQAKGMMDELFEMQMLVQSDQTAMYQNDPSLTCIAEGITTAAFEAVFVYRIAHWLHQNKQILLARWLSEYAHTRSGIDIHPAATIGSGFCIDHGTGIVIGETAIVGNNVRIYHGVTLGAKSIVHPKMACQQKRHPTLEDDVTIYANATVLGGSTVIGRGSVIGTGVIVCKTIQPYAKIVVNTNAFTVDELAR